MDCCRLLGQMDFVLKSKKIFNTAMAPVFWPPFAKFKT